MVYEEEKLVLKTLDELGIQYLRVMHPPLYTVSEAKAYGNFEADGCKNLFLYDSHNDRYYLVVMLEDKKAHSNTIRKQVKARQLVFGSEHDMMRFLGVSPGSVSPFGVVNDAEKKVTILIDEDLPKSTKVCFHPNINKATLVLSYGDFERFLHWSGNDIRFICVTN